MNESIEESFVWRPFVCSFRSPEGQFQFELHAISLEHAQLQLQSLKENAVVDGELKGTRDA